MFKPILTTLALLYSTLIGLSGEQVIVDNQGAKCFVYTPKKIDSMKRYWLVVGVHGLGGNGKSAGGLKAWAETYDCIVIGPNFTPGYQAGNGSHARKLIDLQNRLEKQYKLHNQMFLHGFSAGAQFVHRFAFNHPDKVGGVSAHSAGSWATGGGFGEINTRAKKIPFAISCGEKDTAKSVPQYTMNRLQWFKLFEKQMKQKRFNVTSKVIPGVKHRQSKEARAMAEACFKEAQRVFPAR